MGVFQFHMGVLGWAVPRLTRVNAEVLVEMRLLSEGTITTLTNVLALV